MKAFTKRGATAAAAGVAAIGLLLSGCAGGNSSSNSSSASSETGTESNQSFIYITSDPIGQNEFLKSGQIGINAVAEANGGKAKTFESKDDETRRSNLDQAVNEAPAVIVMLGFQFADLAAEYAEAYPDQKFLLIDTTVEGDFDNLYTATFREQEPSYLLGVEAALLSQSKKVGSVMSLDIPLLHKYNNGFAQGATDTASDVEAIAPQYVGGENPFADTARAKEQALAFAATGVDQVFAVAAAANGGIHEAAAEKGFYTYGVDANQCGMAPGHVVDGTIKAVNKVVETVVGEILAGKSPKDATSSFGLAEEGMTVVSLTDDAADSGCVVMSHPEIIEKVEAAAKAIKAGDITVAE
ncbi:BMP family ABC transporter substrate-binding protein [Canibacter zhoujuaniae]|uniref:BMP family ABC transporter substrate-binding protein n=1 Tax=Canibacter zhoujuaniae TaxID=2708343 RepID=UPI00142369D6|nr:BMP family ABC transporter substrate-binding protein [Canibacter zhoujuaniae]